MRILFESYPYETTRLAALLSERYYLPLDALRSKIHYVGYYHDTTRGESVMVLPKVFLKPLADNRMEVFGYCTPEELLELDNDPILRAKLKTTHKLEFLYRISTWLFLAIRQYAQRHRDTSITEESEINAPVSTLGDGDTTELEVIQSLIKFNREHQQLFTYIRKFNSSQKKNVSWARTIGKRSPILQNGVPVYVEIITKNKKNHYDEELLVVFFSVLHHLNETYYLNIPLNPLYPIRKGAAYAALSRKGTRLLKQIKYKYFNDSLLKLWHLLYLYFEQAERARNRGASRHELMIRDFNLVFEDMVDVLLSEPNLPQRLKDHKDGKQIDHIYPYHDLLTEQDYIYHIGDSKYYGANTALSTYDVSKQYTYARNVIQYNVDWLNAGKASAPIRYRDPLTEGYNITPNFFISAFVDDTLDFQTPGLTYQKTFPINKHFKDRLFDRDTLLLQAYNINFLYVLATYVSGSAGKRKVFKEDTRTRFRGQVVRFLNKKYEFYKLTDSSHSGAFLEKNFRLLHGKLYRPSEFTDSYLLALEKGTDTAQLFLDIDGLDKIQVETHVLQ